MSRAKTTRVTMWVASGLLVVGSLPGCATTQSKEDAEKRQRRAQSHFDIAVDHVENGRVELYHLKSDVGEENDLADRMPLKAAELRRMLHEWRDALKARMPEGEPRDDFKTWLSAASGRSGQGG